MEQSRRLEFGSALREQSVAIAYAGTIKGVNKAHLMEYLLSVIRGTDCGRPGVEDYTDAFDWILRNLFRTASITLYFDGVIRLTLRPEELWETRRRCLLLDESEVRDSSYNSLLFDILRSFEDDE
ncbi:MAG: hypothetical protein IJ217_01320 [Clostridia bacterium]|nr:hypothetical protein [Clostridia bacterium]